VKPGSIQMRIDYANSVKGIGATKVLRAAQKLHRLLKAIEKEKTGKRPELRWEVDICTAYSCAIITFSCERAEALAIVQEAEGRRC
jgi:hypothetical protein